MMYKYRTHKDSVGTLHETCSLEDIFMVVRDFILDADEWDYEVEFHEYLNEYHSDIGPIPIHDYLNGKGEINFRHFDYADWLQENCDEEYTAWYNHWIEDFAESEADCFVSDLEDMPVGSEYRMHGVKVIICEDEDDYVED